MVKQRPKGLIVSPYHAASHAVWAEQVRHSVPQVEWQVLALPARFFSWRIRGNPLSLAYEAHHAAAFENLDVLVVTSMTDLATLRGLLPQINGVPTLIYFHENQFAYPSSHEGKDARTLEPKMVTLYGALAADAVVFNSNFNRDSFLTGAREMLTRFPDHAPLGCIDRIVGKSAVIPVPLPQALSEFVDNRRDTKQAPTATLKVAWNHRWEFDKGPDRLARIIELSAGTVPNVEFHIFGQQFRQLPTALQQLAASEQTCIRHMGYVDDRKTYYEKLSQCDVVLSTALHDFQGLAVLEAVALGCTPLVPNRLAYLEFIPTEYRYRSVPDDIEAECAAAVEYLCDFQRLRAERKLTRAASPACLDAERLAGQYQGVINRLLAHSG